MRKTSPGRFAKYPVRGPEALNSRSRRFHRPQWASWPPGLAAGGGGRTSIVRDNDLIIESSMGRGRSLRREATAGLVDGSEETEARIRQIARDVLGLAVLRPAQVEAAAALAAGRDCLAVLPSGAGTTRACPVDHGTGWRSQIRIEATSTVPRQT